MTISLPLMNNLCKRWTLPPHIIQNCDFYFLRNYSDPDFVQLLEVEVGDDGESYFYIQEYGINFRVIFQHDSLEVYRKNGELDKRNEPNNTRYWLSFRSLTFTHNGKDCTRSYALVQVDKGQNVTRTPKAPVGLIETDSHSQKIHNIKQIKLFNSFADRSQPRETEIPEIDEEV